MRRTTQKTLRQRIAGFSMLEILAVLAVGAGIIGAGAAVVVILTIRQDANNILTAISEYERDLGEHLRRRHIEDPNATPPPCVGAHNLGTGRHPCHFGRCYTF